MSEQLRRIGYLRNSLNELNPNIQADALKQAGCTDIFEATESLATPATRKRLLDLLDNGDKLIVYRLDRLARDEHTLINLQLQLEAMGVTDDQEATGGGHE